MTEQDDNALDVASGYALPNALDPALMSTPNPLESVGGFDPSQLTPQDAPPGSFTVPNHTAADDGEPAQELPGEEKRGRFSRQGRAPKAPKREKTVPPKQRPGALVRPLTQMYTSVGTLLLPFDPMCGTAVISNAEDMAKSLDALARENDAVRRALMAMTQTSAWGGVMIAHLPLLLAIMAHHAPEDVKRTVSPLAVLMNGGGMPFPSDPPAEPAA